MNPTDWTPAELAGDCKRASALLLHHLDNNTDGVAAVLQEAIDLTRSTPMVLALLDLTVSVAPGLDTDDGRQWLRTGIARLAAREVEQ